jgi:hypothetical protein
MTTGGTTKVEASTPTPSERETESSPNPDRDSNVNFNANSTPNPRLVIPISGGDEDRDRERDPGRDRPISGARRDRPDSGSRLRTAGSFREDPGNFKKEKLLGDMQKASPEGHGYLPGQGTVTHGAGVGSLKGLEEGGEFHDDSDDSRPISPRRRRAPANDSISQGSAVSDAINDAVKPIVSHALIISSVNAFISFVGLALEASRPQAAQLLTDSQTDANSAPTPAPAGGPSTSSSTTSSTRMEEIYWGLMSCLRAFLHVTYLVMIFQVLMGRLHLKKLYTYVLYSWCVVLSICFIIIQTAASDDKKTPFNAEVAMQVADMAFFAFSCYVLSMSRAEARGADVSGN